ncbi:MAG: lipocalin family protein [Bacteroidetes bacterium]|nr:lipocalin family protein [Bacteroidota bacterium]
MILCFACSTNQNVPKVVPSVDLQRYAGKWYEIASFPVSFEKGCSCISAEYTLTDKDYVKVYNSCRKGGPNGKISSITGKAFVVPGSNNAKLKVQFFWPFRAPYWIIGLADDYSWAIISGPSRKYLWILSRSRTMDPMLYSQLIDKLKADGFDTGKIVKANQECD